MTEPFLQALIIATLVTAALRPDFRRALLALLLLLPKTLIATCRIIRPHTRPKPSHGSATFATRQELRKAGLLGGKGFILGKLGEQFISSHQPGHEIVFAPTRSGKGVGLAVPNLLEHRGAVVVNDIKGELIHITGRRRLRFGPVYALAPFEDWSSSYNPLDFIRIGTDYEIDDAKALAHLLVTPGSHKEAYWEEQASLLLTGLILQVLYSEDSMHRNLPRVRELLTRSADQFSITLEDMARSEHILIQRVANAMSKKEGKDFNYTVSEAIRQTEIWDNPNLIRISCKSDFRFEQLKEHSASVFVVVPPDMLEVYRSFLRVTLGQALAAMTRNKTQLKHPVLFLLDEFPSLGRMPLIEKGIGYHAGYGVSLWLFVQNLGQLKSVYDNDAYENFIANCRVRQAFGVADVATAKLLSEMLGAGTIRQLTQAQTGGLGDPVLYDHFIESWNDTARQLLTADEILNLPPDEQLIFINGVRPIRAKKIRYFREDRWRGLYDRWGE